MPKQTKKALLKSVVTARFAAKLEKKLEKEHIYFSLQNVQDNAVNVNFLSASLSKVKYKESRGFTPTALTFLQMRDIAVEIYKDFDPQLGAQLETLISKAGWVGVSPIIKNPKKIVKRRNFTERDMVFYYEPKTRMYPTNEVWYKFGNLRRVIILQPNKNIYGILTLVHEFGHWLSSSTSFENLKEPALAEIFSKFMERYAMNYLFKKEIANEKDVEEFHEMNKKFFVFLARLITTAWEISKEFPAEIVLKSRLKKMIDRWKKNNDDEVLTDKLNDLLSFARATKYEVSVAKYYGYAVAEVFSAILYKDYQNEPGRTRLSIKTFIANDERFSMREAEQLLLGKFGREKIKNNFKDYFLSDNIVTRSDFGMLDEKDIQKLLAAIEKSEKAEEDKWKDRVIYNKATSDTNAEQGRESK